MMVQQFPGVLFMFFALSLMCGNADAAGDIKWDYHSEKYGVNAWPTLFPVCNGKRQSPIDIVNAKYDSSLGDIQLTNYDNNPASVTFTAKNNGHTYTVSFAGYTDANHPKIHGGGLPSEFALAGFHFHWRTNKDQGSEHLVNGMSYPAELHLVHLNKKYPNVSEGVKHGDGLAVLGVFIMEGEHNNNFQFLNLTEHNVTYPDMTSNFNLSSLMSLLPSNKTFYRYNGSLTTPRCQEAVIWTVFSHHIELSIEQLSALRKMKYVNTTNQIVTLADNFRPPQALNGRMVLANFHLPPMAMTTPSRAMPTPSSTEAPTPSNTEAPTPSGTDQTTMATTDGAYRVSENYFMFLTSFCLVLLSFLEI